MADNSEYKLDPGPLESDVLTGQLTHRSQDIWEGSVNLILNTRRQDGNFWKLVEKHPIHPRVVEVIRLSGLYGVYRANRPAIDRSLITALVERWRPETHTFHFRTGEATITLQDVEVLYGLPVNGDPVLGDETTRTIGDWQNICQRLLGFAPIREDFKNNSLKAAAFNTHMLSQPQLSDMATQDMIHQKARCYMFWMIAGMMMADTSGGYLKLMYLPMLEDVDKIGSYSWGSATLACLYNFLCKASQSTQNEIAGFLSLLQIWAWERVTVLSPQIVAQRDVRTIYPDGLPRGPHATRWFAHLSWTKTTKHVLKVYRDVLDSMTEDQFIWEPYSDDLIESLPVYCRAGRNIWRVRVPIFCWDVVEVHLPDRVMRQFGLQQVIPTPFPFDATHFRHDRRGRPNTNWELEHAQWLPFWNQRLQYSCDAPVNHEPLRYDDPYLIWFRRITRLVIGNPNSRPERQQGYVPSSTAYETMVRHIHSMVDEAKALGDNPSYEALYMFRRMVRDQGSDCLKYVHEADRIHVSADYRRDVVEPVQLHPPVRRRGKGGVAGRRERAVEREQAPVEVDQATQNAQKTSEGDQTTSNHDIGSTSRGRTQESFMAYQPSQTDIVTPQTPQILRDPSLSSLENVFCSYQPQHFENAPNFSSSPVEGNELNKGGTGCGTSSGTEQIVPLDSTPVPVTSTSSISLPSSPIPSTPQIPISWPEDGTLTLAWVTNLMSAFDWASKKLPPSELSSVLPIEEFDRLVATASGILHKEPNCLQIDSGSGLGPNSTVVVVGDVHGQLHDVLFLLKDAGLPSENRFFVFNGDYVDRGAWGLETFLVLLAWKVLMPNRVFLLRGNHESKYCTAVYGFEKEVLIKYADKGTHVYQKCLGCFKNLPLASIIAGNVYTAHGGIFRSISGMQFKKAKGKGKKRRKIVLNPDVGNFSLGSLEELLQANRFVLNPSWGGANLIPGDVMWSDPSEKPRLSENDTRGIGLLWGCDCTEEFLQKFNLKLIIRSHEGPDARAKRPKLRNMDKGYTIDHEVNSGKLITLFSAPDYPQFQATDDRYQNKGAYIVLEPPNFDTPDFHSFEAATPRPKVNPYYDYENVIDSDEELDLESMEEKD